MGATDAPTQPRARARRTRSAWAPIGLDEEDFSRARAWQRRRPREKVTDTGKNVGRGGGGGGGGTTLPPNGAVR